MKKILSLIILTIIIQASPFDMSLAQCSNLTTELKEAENRNDYNKVMDVGGMIFLGCDKHLSKEQMDMVLEAIDRTEKRT